MKTKPQVIKAKSLVIKVESQSDVANVRVQG